MGCLFLLLICQLMGNSWFQFKQFRIAQDRCALKVGTDACILGAWAPAPAAVPKNALDIGTGTGLLALMLAQRFAAAAITALEPEPAAAEQAKENFQNSPWADRLQLLSQRVQHFEPSHRFDLIVCNPPFYPNHLKTANHKRNLALHQEELSFQELAQACARLLAPQGICSLLLPPRQAEAFEQEAQPAGLWLQGKLLVRERANSPFHRTVYTYGFQQPQHVQSNELTIRDADNHYSTSFRQLLQPFYLNI